MADFAQTPGTQALRRRFPENPSYGILAERRLIDRAQEYDKALRQSQSAAIRRRTNIGKSGNGVNDTPKHDAATVADVVPPAATSQTVQQENPLEESNINPFPDESTGDHFLQQTPNDGEIKSDLGGSYVDGKVSRARPSSQPSASLQEENDVDNPGMLTLLGQIYETRGPGYGRVI